MTVSNAGLVKSLISEELNLQEEALLTEFSGAGAPVVFVVCAPRVGSTLVYQMLSNYFKLTHISNLVNDYFSMCPIVGYAHQIISDDNDYLVNYRSLYGKTLGARETSEGSAILGGWFGGKHPSELNSTNFIDADRRRHMQKTVSAINGMTGSPLLVKNPWNSFRIKSLSEAFPEAQFVWIRRDIEASSISDLENRYKLGEPSKIWNSATTFNYKEIMEQPYWEQVVLQQYYYSLSIEQSLTSHASGRNIEVWYEDLCESTSDVLGECLGFFSGNGIDINDENDFNDGKFEIKKSSGPNEFNASDILKIKQFVSSDPAYESLKRQA